MKSGEYRFFFFFSGKLTVATICTDASSVLKHVCKYSELFMSTWSISKLPNTLPLKDALLKSPYPTVVMEIKDHQNPSQDPLKNERGNSSLFQ